ncbi:hypothetical protein Droror1_Dr00021195 [Drosera rotundifolia]
MSKVRISATSFGAGKASGEAIRPAACAMMEIDPEPAKNQRHVEFAKQEAAPIKGGLPQGFFDNKDVDLRARDGDGSLVTWTCDYEKANEEVPASELFKDFVVKTFHDLDAYLLKA